MMCYYAIPDASRPLNFPRIVWMMLWLGMSGACSDPSIDQARDDGAVAIAIDSIGDVPVLRVAGDPPHWSIRDVVRLGHGVGAVPDDPEGFAWVSSVAVGPSLGIYVADLGRDRIAHFDSAGEFVRFIGGEGQGPEEFEELFSIAWIDSTLLAMDIGNARATAFSHEGDWLKDWQSAGRLVASPVDFRLYSVEPGTALRWSYMFGDSGEIPTWVHHDSRNDTTTLGRYTPPVPARAGTDRVVCRIGRGYSWFVDPFAPRGLAHPMAGGKTVTASSDEYRLTILAPDFDTLLVIERDVPPPQLSDSLWAEVDARFRSWLSDKDVDTCQPSGLERPDTRLHIESLMVDQAGRIWVERNLTRGTRWEIFSEKGDLLGSLPGFEHDRERTVPWLGKSRIAWVTRGLYDVPYVRFARLSESG